MLEVLRMAVESNQSWEPPFTDEILMIRCCNRFVIKFINESLRVLNGDLVIFPYKQRQASRSYIPDSSPSLSNFRQNSFSHLAE